MQNAVSPVLCFWHGPFDLNTGRQWDLNGLAQAHENPMGPLCAHANPGRDLDGLAFWVHSYSRMSHVTLSSRMDP